MSAVFVQIRPVQIQLFKKYLSHASSSYWKCEGIMPKIKVAVSTNKSFYMQLGTLQWPYNSLEVNNV